MILSGSWGYTTDEIKRIGSGRRDKILLLASEKNIKGVQRLAGLVDGDEEADFPDVDHQPPR